MRIHKSMNLARLNARTLVIGAPDEVLAIRDSLVREHADKELSSLSDEVLGELINRTLAAMPE